MHFISSEKYFLSAYVVTSSLFLPWVTQSQKTVELNYQVLHLPTLVSWSLNSRVLITLQPCKGEDLRRVIMLKNAEALRELGANKCL